MISATLNKIKVDNMVLIVDDIDINIKLISEILKRNNIEASSALSGEEALLMANQNPPDLILLDVSMPQMDGFEVCKKLQDNPFTNNIPIIFLTARNQTEDVVKGLELGAVDYLTKPYKSQELVTRIKIHLELKKAKDTIKLQNLKLSQTNNQLNSSLKYAWHIQQKLLPKLSKIQNCFTDSFILFKPKHQVSGDFYWLYQTENQIIICVIDCTGHGIPGALMSMIANTLLNEIIIKKKNYNPELILEELNHEFIYTIFNNESEKIGNEGMDISICNINKSKKKLKISSANNDVCLFIDDKFITVPGQIYPIGSIVPEDEAFKFKNKSFNITSNTSIYLFTDGYQDQFGGLHNQKIQISNLHKSLKEIYKLPFSQQKSFLLQKIKKWQGSNDQTDDILIVGLKI